MSIETDVLSDTFRDSPSIRRLRWGVRPLNTMNLNLALRPVDTITSTLEFLQDRVGRCHPDERLRGLVVLLGEGHDLLLEWRDAAECGALDGALAEEREPALDLVQPRGIGRGEVQVEAHTCACLRVAWLSQAR